MVALRGDATLLIITLNSAFVNCESILCELCMCSNTMYIHYVHLAKVAQSQPSVDHSSDKMESLHLNISGKPHSLMQVCTSAMHY